MDDRIFVTVGNGLQPFRRLIDHVDGLLATGALRADVTVQTGAYKSFTSNHCKASPFFAPATFAEFLKSASVVISHGGAGSLLSIMALRRVPVVIPRLKMHDEIIDDHQVELVQLLGEGGLVIPVYDVCDLLSAIDSARRAQFPTDRSGGVPAIVDVLRDTLGELLEVGIDVK